MRCSHCLDTLRAAEAVRILQPAGMIQFIQAKGAEQEKSYCVWLAYGTPIRVARSNDASAM